MAAYPRWQAYLREHRPPTLIVWGKYDSLFTVDGALAFGREVPDAEIQQGKEIRETKREDRI